MKPCVIKQPAGIGDIFFCQKIARYMAYHGYQIIWPINPDIIWIRDYIKGILFCSTEDEFPMKDIYDKGTGYVIEDTGAFISTATADMTHNDSRIMSSKYTMLGMDYSDWRKYFIFERNLDKENDLYYNVLGLTDDSQYVFLNNMASVDVRTSDVLDDLTFEYPVVNLQIIENFSLFDWCKVFENAIEIHTVHTGINYILDKLNLKAKKYYMYQGLHHSDVQYIPFAKKPKFIPNK